MIVTNIKTIPIGEAKFHVFYSLEGAKTLVNLSTVTRMTVINEVKCWLEFVDGRTNRYYLEKPNKREEIAA
jgi:hypothetical protein